LTAGVTAHRRRLARACLLFAGAFALLLVMDGSRQPESGSGWQVLAYQRGLGRMDSVVAIADQPALAAAYETLHLTAAPPALDFRSGAAFLISGIGTVGCPARFEGVGFDLGRRVVTAWFARRLMFDCDPSRVPDTFIVVLDRSRMPPAPFRVEIGDSSLGVPGGGTDVR
jgi:hypothetical protein